MNLICVAVCLLLLKPFAEFICGIEISWWVYKHDGIDKLEELVDAIESGDDLTTVKITCKAASEIVEERRQRG